MKGSQRNLSHMIECRINVRENKTNKMQCVLLKVESVQIYLRLTSRKLLGTLPVLLDVEKCFS